MRKVVAPAGHAARSAHEIRLKRAYDAPAPEDGARFLVDRLWPRGVTKAHLQLTAWLKELGPSTELRRWFNHQVERWPEFQTRYRAELAEREAWLRPILEASRKGPVTLVYASRDAEHNNAVVLQEILTAHRSLRDGLIKHERELTRKVLDRVRQRATERAIE